MGVQITMYLHIDYQYVDKVSLEWKIKKYDSIRFFSDINCPIKIG